MGNDDQTLDKTYTSSENSVFDLNMLDLKILLPENSEENPYTFRAFDISQIVDNVQQNALFIYMKKETDDASDLSASDDDMSEYELSLPYENIITMDFFSNCSRFDPTADSSLIMVYHDASDDNEYQFECAMAAFAEVPNFITSVGTNGNFQTTLELSSGTPKKTGMSMVPRRS